MKAKRKPKHWGECEKCFNFSIYGAKYCLNCIHTEPIIEHNLDYWTPRKKRKVQQAAQREA